MPPCLSSFSTAWESLSASPEIVRIVKYGHEIKFDEKPVLTKPLGKFSTKLPEEQMVVIRKEIQTLMSKGAVKVVSKNIASKKLGVYSKMFCVPKPGTNQWRPIINLKPLNKYIQGKLQNGYIEGCKMSTSARRLWSYRRPYRCLFSYKNTQKEQKISSLYF